jgi:hypothetical protein
VDRPASQHQGEHFQAAIARHQLNLHTELKRSTSLPSAMFDATDPMLEARLCAATEELFRCLLEHDQPLAAAAGDQQRLEPVARDEVAGLLAAALAGAFADTTTPDLSEFEDAELQALLAETCARSHGQAQFHAAELLRGQRPFGAGHLDELTHELAQSLGALHALPNGDDDANMTAICRKVAAAVLRCTATLENPPA